jgi:drug/metabolite transporter (DMT)-like permease
MNRQDWLITALAPVLWSVIFMALSPFWALLPGWPLLGEQLRPIRIIMIAIGVAGVAFLVRASLVGLAASTGVSDNSNGTRLLASYTLGRPPYHACSTFPRG